MDTESGRTHVAGAPAPRIRPMVLAWRARARQSNSPRTPEGESIAGTEAGPRPGSVPAISPSGLLRASVSPAQRVVQWRFGRRRRARCRHRAPTAGREPAGAYGAYGASSGPETGHLRRKSDPLCRVSNAWEVGCAGPTPANTTPAPAMPLDAPTLPDVPPVAPTGDSSGPVGGRPSLCCAQHNDGCPHPSSAPAKARALNWRETLRSGRHAPVPPRPPTRPPTWPAAKGSITLPT